jgi:hypothetical protein
MMLLALTINLSDLAGAGAAGDLEIPLQWT